MWEASQIRSESVLALWQMNAACASLVGVRPCIWQLKQAQGESVFVAGKRSQSEKAREKPSQMTNDFDRGRNHQN